MDYKELSKVADATIKAPIEERKKKIKDAIMCRREARKTQKQVADSKEYKKFKVTDAFADLKKRIKDNLYETETTEDAVSTVIEALEGQPAEQVLAAAVEVLAETIDVLQAEKEFQNEEEPEGEGSEE